jgi:ferrochelatase
VDVICPGFVADCLETLEEIAMEGKAEFLNAGGGQYRYIPCLNDRHTWISAMADLAVDHLGSWFAGPWDGAKEKDECQNRAERARALGAKT